MNRLLLATILSIYAYTAFAVEIPLPDGTYDFMHKYAEHPNMESIIFHGVVKNGSITLTNKEKSSVFPIGVIEEGQLYWHSSSNQWIIINSEEEKNSTEVGGCSDGPSVIDLYQMVYWTC